MTLELGLVLKIGVWVFLAGITVGNVLQRVTHLEKQHDQQKNIPAKKEKPPPRRKRLSR